MRRDICLFFLLIISALASAGTLLSAAKDTVLLSAAAGPADSSSAAGLQPLVLFDFGQSFDTGAVTVTDAEISLSPAGALCIRTHHKEPWPGVTLKAPAGKWDLSEYEYVAIEVRNLSDQSVSVHCRVDNPGADGEKNCVTESIALKPQAAGKLAVNVFPVPWRLSEPLELVGMRAAPIYAGKIDPSNVTQLLVFVNSPKADHVFEIDNVIAGGHVQVLNAKTYLPFIDEFGQFIHKDWPGKTHSVEELIAYGRAEEKDLAANPGHLPELQREIKKHPDSSLRSPADRDQYGGWSAGPQLEATRAERSEGVCLCQQGLNRKQKNTLTTRCAHRKTKKDSHSSLRSPATATIKTTVHTKPTTSVRQIFCASTGQTGRAPLPRLPSVG